MTWVRESGVLKNIFRDLCCVYMDFIKESNGVCNNEILSLGHTLTTLTSIATQVYWCVVKS